MALGIRPTEKMIKEVGPRWPKGSPFGKGTWSSSPGQKGLLLPSQGTANFRVPKEVRMWKDFFFPQGYPEEAGVLRE